MYDAPGVELRGDEVVRVLREVIGQGGGRHEEGGTEGLKDVCVVGREVIGKQNL